MKSNSSSLERIVCARCTAPFAPSLTHGRCPVCSTPASDEVEVRRSWDDPDDRLMAIVIAATFANVLLLAILTLVVLS